MISSVCENWRKFVRLGPFVLLGALGCRVEPPAARGEPRTEPAAAAAAAAASSPTQARPEESERPPTAPLDRVALATRFPAPARVVALGDVHGDLAATRGALRLAGAIDQHDQWIGGDLVVVQTGDQLDRGDQEQAIVDLFEQLRRQAKAAGGAFHALLGNHELMNVAGDLRYVTPGGFQDFEDVDGLDLDDPKLRSVPPAARARLAALSPAGPYAQILARRNTVVVVGDSVFVHGGVLPEHVPQGVADLERINIDVRRWLMGVGDRSSIEDSVLSNDGVVWTREYASDAPPACTRLATVLDQLGVKRMVVGHTVQNNGIRSGCNERVWRIDVGMAAHYGGPIQVLQIEGERVKVLEPPPK